jgi:spore germination cell wall hydrolase CwlJ-like protein
MIVTVIATMAAGGRTKRAEDVLRATAAAMQVDIPRISMLPPADRDAVTCTALAIYNEARGEPERGRMAVAITVRNRMRERHLTACQTVFEPWQFSWTSETVARQVPRDPAIWSRSLREAYAVLVEGQGNSPWNHFVATAIVRPAWLRGCTIREMIGGHLFCHIPLRRLRR